MLGVRKFSFNCLKSSALQALFKNNGYSTVKLTAAIESAPLDENIKNNVKTNLMNEITKLKEYKSNSLVATAFASLQTEDGKNITNTKQTYDKRINKATNVDELLSVSDGILTRQNALKVK